LKDVYKKQGHTRIELKTFNKLFFEFIDAFMNNTPCFNVPHSRDFMIPDDDVYHALSSTTIFHHVKTMN
jgi:hypothetical protein